jgi:hypothetical protein
LITELLQDTNANILLVAEVGVIDAVNPDVTKEVDVVVN